MAYKCRVDYPQILIFFNENNIWDGLKELHFVRYTKERPRFSEHLEAIKFVCKDFWYEVFKKQIDNLKTNHRVSLGFGFWINL